MEYSIKLNQAAVQAVIDALGQLPHHQVRGLIDEIAGQANAQQAALTKEGDGLTPSELEGN